MGFDDAENFSDWGSGSEPEGDLDDERAVSPIGSGFSGFDTESSVESDEDEEVEAIECYGAAEPEPRVAHPRDAGPSQRERDAGFTGADAPAFSEISAISSDFHTGTLILSPLDIHVDPILPSTMQRGEEIAEISAISASVVQGRDLSRAPTPASSFDPDSSSDIQEAPLPVPTTPASRKKASRPSSAIKAASSLPISTPESIGKRKRPERVTAQALQSVIKRLYSQPGLGDSDEEGVDDVLPLSESEEEYLPPTKQMRAQDDLDSEPEYDAPQPGPSRGTSRRGRPRKDSGPRPASRASSRSRSTSRGSRPASRASRPASRASRSSVRGRRGRAAIGSPSPTRVADPVADPADPVAAEATETEFPQVWVDGTDFEPQIPAFTRTDSGVQESFPCTAESSPSEFFCAFFDDEVMNLIAHETNVQETVLTNFHDRTIPAKERRWTSVTVPEMYVFLALTMLMAHVKKHSMHDYWIQASDLISTPHFGKYMSRDRYKAILSCLHIFSNLNVRPCDKLWKVRPLYDLLRTRFMSFFKPFRNLVIDESLVLFRGRMPMKQYIPSKRHRWGLKYFIICDCKTGYILDYIIYTGKDMVTEEEKKESGVSGAVVKALCADYFDSGHVLYTDNFYTAPNLAQYLLSRKTATCGTVKAMRAGMPKARCPISWPPKEEVKKGDLHLRKTDGPVLAYQWKDKRVVHLLSTIHKGEWVDSGKVTTRSKTPIYKPDAVIDYNINMRLVDKSDMMIGFIDCLRKNYRWYKKFILHAVDMSLLNAYYMYTHLNPNVAERKWKSLRLFQKQLVSELLDKYGPAQPAPRPAVVMNVPVIERLAHAQGFATHCLVLIPPTASQRATDTRGRRHCRVCARTTRRPRQPSKRTSYMCKHCDVPLCVEPCFAEFHSIENF